MRSRDRLLQGEGKFDAFRNVMLVVGPAFVLTHATAGLSFIALQFLKSDLSRTFGEAGLVTTLIGMLAVLTLVPLLGVLLVRNEARLVTEIRGADSAVDVLRRFWIAARMVSRPGLYSLLGVLVVGGLGLVYANLQPRYRLADQVPTGRRREPSSRCQAYCANPIDVLIEVPQGFARGVGRGPLDPPADRYVLEQARAADEQQTAYR
jgi:uncharacterized membrane protein YdfJ with MMPL/SSD domain